ncbi:MAG TPA: sulfatase-like hydrolase/transferase, partial [Pirellulales bacterium]|nr:sulfatase-like hydrolase/transferase [Pirellulales bacterium]
MIHLNRRWAVLVLMLVPATQALAAEPARPNIVLILLDDFGWADLGCYGSKYHHTPNVDRLAGQGMRFTDAYAACPVCSPSRAAILTGKYPARLHITTFLPGRPDKPSQKLLHPTISQRLPPAEITIADALKSAGYSTACIGKWHLGEHLKDQRVLPTDQGFDVVVGAGGEGRKVSLPAKGKPQRVAREAVSDMLTDEAIRFVDDHRERPFFLYLPHVAVHIPLVAKPEIQARYERLPLPPPGQQRNPVYAATIEDLDANIGRLLGRLKELGLEQNTVVLFTSDNGGLAVEEGSHTPATSNAPLRHGKGFLHEGGIRVPLVVRWPGHVPPGTTCSVPVCGIDFLPTILDICGLPPASSIDGVDILPLLEARGTIHRDDLFWHIPHYTNQGGEPGGAVREGDYKLIEFYEDGRRELYNLKLDPRERDNLIQEHPEQASQLAAKLDAWRKSVGAQTNEPNPDYLPNPQAADGTITLSGSTADIHGTTLHYEPEAHKSTLGYWKRAEDWASFEFTVEKPGTFEVVALVGCGTGSGGSQVNFEVAGQTLPMTVEETGGFQNFKNRRVGQVRLEKPGRYTLSVKPVS